MCHYNEGWANGFNYGIKYWEIWNEPENDLEGGPNQMWLGTKEEYFRLYSVTAKHLKACFGDSIKVGGYGSCGFEGIFFHPEKYGVEFDACDRNNPAYEKIMYRMDFLYWFLDYIKENNAPMDFFSWHSYTDVRKTAMMSDYLYRVLSEYGYGDIEILLDEWNVAWKDNTAGTSYASAVSAAQMISMQNSKTDIMCYYDAIISTSPYAGLFERYGSCEPVSTYYSFVAFGRLYKLKNQVKCRTDDGEVYALAASDGKNKAVLISNISAEDKKIRLDMGNGFTAKIIDEEHFLTDFELSGSEFVLKSNQVIFIENM